jgi:hypothetical protein
MKNLNLTIEEELSRKRARKRKLRGYGNCIMTILKMNKMRKRLKR